jgi:uncharacterized protein YcbK (DUF882 family)
MPKSSDAGEIAEVAPEPPVEMEDSSALKVALHPGAFGLSGELLTTQALPGARLNIPLEWHGRSPTKRWYRWVPVSAKSEKGATDSSAAARTPLADNESLQAPAESGIYHLEVGAGEESTTLDELKLVVQVPFKRKQGTHLAGYFIGRFPTEGKGRTDSYAPPAGFIEVTRENQDLQLSTHFKVREFLTKDQHNVWPKFVVVDPRLLEKLELIMQELNAMGVRADRMPVVSGSRTPQYTARGLGQGRANLSRHQFGDAADVWIDNDGNGYMDDLNGDGKRDTGDVRVMLKAVERVEARHPELVGGAGVYRANSAHGPFLHVDVRGNRARW